MNNDPDLREEEREKQADSEAGNTLAIAMCIGISVGVALGAATHNYGLWIPVGTSIGATVGALLAGEYGTTLDSLVKTTAVEGVGMIPPAPEGKYIWGSVTMNDRGQIVIPKEARDKLGFAAGQRLIVASDEKGIALIPAEVFEEGMRQVREYLASLGETE